MHSKAEINNVVIIQSHISCLLHCLSLCKVQLYVRVSSSIWISNGALLVAFDVKVYMTRNFFWTFLVLQYV